MPFSYEPETTGGENRHSELQRLGPVGLRRVERAGRDVDDDARLDLGGAVRRDDPAVAAPRSRSSPPRRGGRGRRASSRAGRRTHPATPAGRPVVRPEVRVPSPAGEGDHLGLSRATRLIIESTSASSGMRRRPTMDNRLSRIHLVASAVKAWNGDGPGGARGRRIQCLPRSVGATPSTCRRRRFTTTCTCWAGSRECSPPWSRSGPGSRDPSRRRGAPGRPPSHRS